MRLWFGWVLGGTGLAFGQAPIRVSLAPLIGVRLWVGSVALACVTMLVLAFALTALGLCIAWRMNSSQGFHAVMNLFLMPMWFLSGALFPVSGAWRGLQWIMMINPLTYGLAALRRAMYWGDQRAAGTAAAGLAMPSLWTSLAVSLLFAIMMFALASWIAAGRSEADLE
jgi:ABC-2 type transport system permease protein